MSLLLRVSIIVVVMVSGFAAYLAWAGGAPLPQLLSSLQGLNPDFVVASLYLIFLATMVFLRACDEARREAQAAGERCASACEGTPAGDLSAGRDATPA